MKQKLLDKKKQQQCDDGDCQFVKRGKQPSPDMTFAVDWA